MKIFASQVLAALLLACVPVCAQSQAEGNMDALLGPATAVNQGMGMSEEIRQALLPGPEHELLSRLAGKWAIEGTQGREKRLVRQVAEVTSMFGGSWFELRVATDGELVQLAHLGYDRYRKHFAMWEVGRGFTSPQVRVGENRGDELRFWRKYTIRRRSQPTVVRERLILTFLGAGKIRWESFETIEGEGERDQKSVVLTKVAEE